MIGPTLDLALALNRATRRADEWFDEPDDLDRVQRALDSIAVGEDGARYFPVDDRQVADLLVAAAGGQNVEQNLVAVLTSRR